MTTGTINGTGRYAHVDSGYAADLGRRLHDMRVSRKVTQRFVAGFLNCDHSAVSMIENSKYPSLTDDMARRIEDMLFVASQGHETRFMDFVGAERTATALKTWQPLVLPGLMQTAEYALRVLRGANPGRPAAEIAERAAARMTRQEIWAGDNPPGFFAVVAEAAVRKPLGGPLVMGAQLRHLLRMASEPGVTIQVLEAESEHPAGGTAPFVIASFAAGTREPVAHMENALDGTTTPEPEQVARLADLFDDLMREALRPGESARLIERVASQWN